MRSRKRRMEEDALEQKREYTAQEICRRKDELWEEMNLRLVCCGLIGYPLWEIAGTEEEGIRLGKLLTESGCRDLWEELCSMGNILWVEDISVIGVEYQERKQEKRGLYSIVKRISAGIKKFLSFFKRKNKK